MSPTGTKYALCQERAHREVKPFKGTSMRTMLLLCILVGCNSDPGDVGRVLVTDGVEPQSQLQLLESAAGSSGDWPQLFGPDRTCFSRETDVDTSWGSAGPKEAWRKKIGTGYSSPVIAEGKLILLHRQGDEETIQCFSCDTGESLWRYAYPTEYTCKYEYSHGPYSTPVIAGDCVYAIGAQAQMHCLRLADGTLKWQRDLQADFNLGEQLFGFGASPWIEDDKLILNLGAAELNAGIAAFDVHSGATIWTSTDHHASYATPIATTLFDRRYLFVLTYDGLVALDPQDGTVRWIEPFKSKSIDTVNATSPAVWKNHVVVMHGPGAGAKCFKINEDGSHELAWKDRRVLDSQFNSLLTHDGYLYGFTAKREGGSAFRCIDFRTGKLQWSVNSALQRGSCVAVNDRIILWGEEGHLAVIDLDPSAAKGFTITEQSLMEKPCYSAPALSSKKLFLRNEQYVIAFDLTPNIVSENGSQYQSSN